MTSPVPEPGPEETFDARELVDSLRDFAIGAVPAVLVAGLVVATLAGAHVLLRRSAKDGNTTFVHQVVLLSLTIIGGIAIILSLNVDASVKHDLLGIFGLLLSAAIALASTTLLGNFLAGLMIRAVRSFRPGDFIEVEGRFGRVTERGVVHTEIQTEDRDLMTIPNLFIATHPVKVVHADGTIVSGRVSLGYDVPRDDVEEQLLVAAKETGLEEPFVQVLELGDFSVTYRVAGLLREVKNIVSVRSKLLGEMLDALHDRGIEIVSPNFMNQRALDPSSPILPTSRRRRRAKPEGEPEKIIFDKAEQASKEALAEEKAEIEKRLAALPQDENAAGESAADDTAPSERTQLEERLRAIDDALAQE